MTKGPYTYFKTRVSTGIHTTDFYEIYMPQASTEKGKWSYIIKDGELLYFTHKPDAQAVCKEMRLKNNQLLEEK